MPTPIPSVSITNTLKEFELAYGKNVISCYDNNSASPLFVCQIYNSGSTTTAFDVRQFCNLAGYAHFDIQNLLKSQGCSCGQNFEVEELNPYQVIADDFCDHNQDLFEKGEDYEDLINDGWDIVKVERITPTVVHTMQSQKFSNPNAESQLDTENIRVRYKYVGPISSNSRAFCRQMISRNKVYSIEDIERLSNPEFGNYNIFLYRGSFNCKHAWVRLIYKKQGDIRNSGSSRKGVIDQEVVIGADTRNKGTISVGETYRLLVSS